MCLVTVKNALAILTSNHKQPVTSDVLISSFCNRYSQCQLSLPIANILFSRMLVDASNSLFSIIHRGADVSCVHPSWIGALVPTFPLLECCCIMCCVIDEMQRKDLKKKKKDVLTGCWVVCLALTGIKESDTGLAPPALWDLAADKQTLQSEQPLQVAR